MLPHTSAVKVNDAGFWYGRRCQEVILEKVNLDVPRGVIYALLGPSGCGKTTLLNCLVGLRSLKTGHVDVFGQKPGSINSGVPGPWIGYMPQDLCLYAELSIQQTLTYFGRIQRSDAEKLQSRSQFLQKFLDLPGPGRLVRTLSGGQKRRLSLAVALIHKPPLLLLDEPTVGLDPALSQSIWTHLLQLTEQEGLTVLLTTHYIEEARKAHLVGFMRQGRILVENNPETLILKHGAATLEEVFLKFCLQDSKLISQERAERRGNGHLDNKSASPTNTMIKGCETFESQSEHVPFPDHSINEDDANSNTIMRFGPYFARSGKNSLEDFKLPSLRSSWKDHMFKVFAVTSKSLMRLLKNLPFLFFVFLLPVFSLLLARTVFGQDPIGLKLAVFNGEEPARGSKRLLDRLDKTVLEQQSFGTEEEALNALNQGEVVGALLLQPTFTAASLKRLRGGLTLDNETIRNSQVMLDMTGSNAIFRSTAYRTLVQTYMNMTSEVAEVLGASSAAGRYPIMFNDHIFGSEDSKFYDFIVPGYICELMYLIGIAASCLTFAEECEKGMFDRSRVAGVSAVHVVLSQVLLQYVVASFHVCIIVLFVILSGIHVEGSLCLVAFLLLSQNSLGIAQGILLSGYTRSVFVSEFSVLTLQGINFIIGGTVWPLEAQPWLLREISLLISPVTANIQALRFVLTRGLGVGHAPIQLALLVNSFWFAAAFLGVAAVFKFRS